MSIRLILLLLAFICFLLLGVQALSQVNLLAFGLAFWVLSTLIAGAIRK